MKGIARLYHVLIIGDNFLFERPEHWPAIGRADGVQLEQERGDDAEVTAATADCPEQVGMLL